MNGQNAGDDRKEQAEALAFLACPESYGALQRKPPREVERIDTHAARVFLAGNKAVKIKRAVHYPYLDFSGLAQRREACLRELILNRRTAPMLYEGLLALCRRDDGGLAFAGPFGPDDRLPSDRVVEWALLMKRFDSDSLFSKLAARGALTGEMIDRLTTEVLRFHNEAPRLTEAPERAAAAMRKVAEENLEDFRRFPGCFPPDAVAAHGERLTAVLARRAPLLEARAAAGYRRHCHGDLHLGNICLWEGKPLVFDCLEFDDALAEIDLLYDFAFLLMDLLQRGLPAFANRVMNRIAADEDGIAGLALLPLFLSLRAAVRAKVAATLAAAADDPAGAAAQREDAKAYFAAADAYLQPAPPRLIAVGGLSGSGKSSLARALAPSLDAPPGALHLRSDVIRKARFGVDPLTRLPPSAYRPEVSAAVYETLFSQAAAALKAGRTAIADAVFNRPESRDRLAALAAEHDVLFYGIWLDAPVEVLSARVEARRCDASDATAAVVDRQRRQDCGEILWPRLDSSQELGALLTQARNILS